MNFGVRDESKEQSKKQSLHRVKKMEKKYQSSRINKMNRMKLLNHTVGSKMEQNSLVRKNGQSERVNNCAE